MRTTSAIALAAGMALAAAFAGAQGLQTVSEATKLDPSSSAELQAFKERVAAAHPGLDVVSVEADVVKRAVLAPPPPPPPPPKPPVMAIFVKNHTTTRGFDDQVDGIRDRLAAEAAGMDFVIMDSAEIGAAFNRYKVSTAEERAGLVEGLFTGGSVTRVAQMLGADYILTASIVGATSVNRVAGDRQVTVYTLRMATKVLDATTGGSVYGRNWSNKMPVPQGNADDPLAMFDDLVDQWVSDTGTDLAEARPRWRAPVANAGQLASFTVTSTIDAYIRPLEATVDADKQVKADLRVVAGGVTVEVDGAAVGSSGGTFKARPGLHRLRVSRQWMKTWEGTVNIVDGAVFNVALELSTEGFEHYKNKEALRAEIALAYAESAFRRGCKVNFDTKEWQTVTWAPGASATSVSSSTFVQPTTVTTPTVPTIQTPVAPVVETPVQQ